MGKKKTNEHRVRRTGPGRGAYINLKLSAVVVRACLTEKMLTEPRLKVGEKVGGAGLKEEKAL